MLLRILRWLIAFGVLIQLIPFGRQHTNPAVVQEPAWDSPQTRDLAKRACFDCHSNETVWPWYSGIAPVSWLTQRDVNGGRSHLNFSEWNKPQRHAPHAAEEIQKGDMPPWFYLPMHAAARLTEAEKASLIAGFQKMPGFEDTDEKH
jgi:mono/diheme cytochrome c family protein